ncbi:hypothetical protein J6590_022561 [Homalodisca vitripennis]|nr:hypothetical protein J6590_022561 [Homalodisca vitripennis]
MVSLYCTTKCHYNCNTAYDISNEGQDSSENTYEEITTSCVKYTVLCTRKVGTAQVARIFQFRGVTLRTRRYKYWESTIRGLTKLRKAHCPVGVVGGVWGVGGERGRKREITATRGREHQSKILNTESAPHPTTETGHRFVASEDIPFTPLQHPAVSSVGSVQSVSSMFSSAKRNNLVYFLENQQTPVDVCQSRHDTCTQGTPRSWVPGNRHMALHNPKLHLTSDIQPTITSRLSIVIPNATDSLG